MTNRANDKPSGRTVKTRVQTASASVDWKERMAIARATLKGKAGQQEVIIRVCDLNPDLNKLTWASRWHSAWHMRVADPEFTKAVEEAADHFEGIYQKLSESLKKQGLSKPKKK